MTANQLVISPLSESVSLKARTYDALKSAITGMNIYDPGAELKLDERDLSERFGVSRTPLREALAQLDSEGLVRIVPRRGIYIVRKTKREILDMITVWAALESMAARLASMAAPDLEIARLHTMTDGFAIDGAPANVDEYSETNIQFHQSIIGLGDNPVIDRIASELFIHVRAIRHRTIFEADRARRSIQDHRAIVAAIESRETDLAERLVREHTLRLRDHVAAHVELD